MSDQKSFRPRISEAAGIRVIWQVAWAFREVPENSYTNSVLFLRGFWPHPFPHSGYVTAVEIQTPLTAEIGTSTIRLFFRVHAHATMRFPLMHILPEAIAARISPRECRLRLSACEQDVLVMISKGLTNQEIGRGLRISRFTARNHINRILEIGTNTGRGRAPSSPREAAYPLYPEVAMVHLFYITGTPSGFKIESRGSGNHAVLPRAAF